MQDVELLAGELDGLAEHGVGLVVGVDPQDGGDDEQIAGERNKH